MIKKYKNNILSTIFSIVILAVTFILIGHVYSYNPSQGQFLTDKASSLLGQSLDMSTGSFWDQLDKSGKLTCFWHKETGTGMNNSIHSVFDTGFDETKGVMRVYSIINDGNKTQKTTYANGSNTTVGKLAAEASRDHNAFNVQKALYQAIKAGTVVNESAIVNEMDWKDPNTTVENPASQTTINEYNNYQKIKDALPSGTKTEEKEKEVTINNKEYTIMGPFKVTFGLKGINKITAANATWTNSSKNEIYWSTSTSEEAKDWSNEFNKSSSGKFNLSNKQFYLAVETEKLPDDGNYTVKITQDSFSYYNARIAVCVGARSQQTGLYVYDNSPHTVNGEVSWTLKRKSIASMTIVKKDKTKGIELAGGKFKIYAVLKNGKGQGWVSGDANGSKTYGNTATEYPSLTKIEKLKYGTYYIYETEAPEGYDITKQDGYHKAAVGSDLLTGDWVYLGSQELKSGAPKDGFKFEAENKKIVDELEGYVWVDEPDTKANATDNIYNKDSKDFLKEGITTNLRDGNGNLLATTKTDATGHYAFKTKNAPSYTGEDKNIYYWDLADAYVEFEYNNKTTYNDDGTVKDYGYVVVNPFTGTDAKVNSKAQEYTVTKEKLNDNNLTGVDGANPGRAITNKDAGISDAKQLVAKNKEIYEKIQNNTASESDLNNVPLACYYDSKTFKVTDINLGLLEQYDPDYSVDETLAYIKVRMKGYTYTYKYGDAAVTTSTNVPTVNEQNSAKTFTGKIYPTDIAYNTATGTDELKVYVVYSIDVKNLETMYVDNVYTEQRLYLDSLVNTYDTNRYELCNNENNSDKSDFALWQDLGNGKASYDVNNENSVYKNGMAKQETKTSYIQYRIKDEALKKILEKSLTYEDIEKAPTIATASGYHEYLRTDNAWVHNKDVRAFDGVKGLNIYPISNGAQKKYYVHKSISKVRSSADLYLKLSLGDSRKLSGTVFEDTRTEESKNDNTNLGNGILDSNESNRAQKVTVELLDSDKQTVSKLYQEKDGKVVYKEDGTLPDARIETEVGGTYEFDGVVPGYYYLRFTYGDGTQKMMPAGTDIKSNDYKSTIINTEANGAGDLIKNAMEVSEEELKSAQATLTANQTDAQKKIVEWYKYLNNSNYSTAVDNLEQRSEADKYEYKDDGKVYDESGNEVQGYPKNINAYTPISSISIENDINTSTDEGDAHKSKYEGFNFGLIEAPDTEIKLDKMITNVKFTTQTGTTLVSANPTDKSAEYITALDKITGGSKYAKMEMEQNLIYGSELATTYEITVENNSTKDYIEDEGSNEYGHYYYYGEKTETSKLKTVKVNEVVDELDKKYNYDSKQETATSSVKHADGNTESTEISITKNNPDGSVETQNSLSMKGWKEIESGATETMSYTVTSLLSNDNDTGYTNKARITSLSLDKLSTLKSNFNWELTKDTTTLTITPPTGSDRSATYWIAGALGLLVLAAGIVFLKKKVLNK